LAASWKSAYDFANLYMITTQVQEALDKANWPSTPEYAALITEYTNAYNVIEATNAFDSTDPSNPSNAALEQAYADLAAALAAVAPAP
jgi:hypothetical protein